MSAEYGLATRLHAALCHRTHTGDDPACRFYRQPWPTQWHFDLQARNTRWTYLRMALKLLALESDDGRLARIADILAGREP